MKTLDIKNCEIDVSDVPGMIVTQLRQLIDGTEEVHGSVCHNHINTTYLYNVFDGHMIILCSSGPLCHETINSTSSHQNVVLIIVLLREQNHYQIQG